MWAIRFCSFDVPERLPTRTPDTSVKNTFPKSWNIKESSDILKKTSCFWKVHNVKSSLINELHLHYEYLRLCVKGTIFLAENFISKIQKFWCNVDSYRGLKHNFHQKEKDILLPSNLEPLIDASLNSHCTINEVFY